MEQRDLVYGVRTILDDHAVPPLHCTKDIVDHLNGAITEAAIRTRVIQDSTSPVARLSIVAGTAQYTIPKAVFAIRRIVLAGQRHSLELFDTSMMDCAFPGWDDATLAPRGVPTHAVFDYETGALRVYPIPSAPIVARMTVWRTPTEEQQLDEADVHGSPALPELMHRELVHWAAAQCALGKDAETRDPSLAREQFALFEAAYGRKPDMHEIRLWSTNKRRHVRPCFD